MPTTTPRSRARGRGVWLVVWLIVLKAKSKRQKQKIRSERDGRSICRLSIFIAFISFYRGNAFEGSIFAAKRFGQMPRACPTGIYTNFQNLFGTESIVAASNRIIHQLCGFPHHGDGAITLAAFALMITIGSSMRNTRGEAKKTRRSKKGVGARKLLSHHTPHSPVASYSSPKIG